MQEQNTSKSIFILLRIKFATKVRFISSKDQWPILLPNPKHQRNSKKFKSIRILFMSSWSTQRRLFSEYYAHQVCHRNEKSRLNKEVYSMKRTSYRALSLSFKDTNDLPTWIKTTLTFFSKWFHKQILPVNSPVTFSPFKIISFPVGQSTRPLLLCKIFHFH